MAPKGRSKKQVNTTSAPVKKQAVNTSSAPVKRQASTSSIAAKNPGAEAAPQQSISRWFAQTPASDVQVSAKNNPEAPALQSAAALGLPQKTAKRCAQRGIQLPGQKTLSFGQTPLQGMSAALQSQDPTLAETETSVDQLASRNNHPSLSQQSASSPDPGINAEREADRNSNQESLQPTPDVSLQSCCPKSHLESTVGARVNDAMPITASLGSCVHPEEPPSKFLRQGNGSWTQYHGLYALRLETLRNRVKEEARTVWGHILSLNRFLPTIASYGRGDGCDVVLVGVLFKEMKSRPSIIDHYRKCKDCSGAFSDNNVEQKIWSEADRLWIEDAGARLQLEIKKPKVIEELVTGLVVGVRGALTDDGKFQCKGLCFASSMQSHSNPMPQLSPVRTRSGPCVMLLSGIWIGSTDEHYKNRVVQFFKAQGQCVKRLILCGGIIAPEHHKETLTSILQEADDFLASLASEVPVDLLPGRQDPTNVSLPQAPIYTCLFPKARCNRNFRCVCNPHETTVGSLRLLGHSGQPIDDLLRCTSQTNALKALLLTLASRHLAPTAPDTLLTQPFEGCDPFVIEECPDVLFSGGHTQAEWQWVPGNTGQVGTMCVCVPAFGLRPCSVIVNVFDPRDVQVHEFDC